MKKIYYLVMALICATSANAQVTIGENTDPHDGAVLELKSPSKGFLLPRVSLTSITDYGLDGTASSAAGMVVYNINSEIVGGNGVGVYVWDGSKWGQIGNSHGNIPATELPKASISSDISPGNVITGTAVTLTVAVTSEGSNTYQWSKRGSKLTGETGTVLSISSITVGDQFSCVVTNSQGTTTVYWSTCGAYVGAEWLSFMCHNLGADESKDPFTYDEAILGDLYQWGRIADGHQIRTSGTVTGPATSGFDANGQIATTATDYYGKFITTSATPYDWINPKKDDLWWDAENGMNNAKTISDPCPEGWKVPNVAQLESVFSLCTSYNQGLMIGTSLYLPEAGSRRADGSLYSWMGHYWSSTANGTISQALEFPNSGAERPMWPFPRAYGLSVRCVAE